MATSSEAEIIAVLRLEAEKMPELRVANYALAEQAAAYARSIAPIGDEDKGDKTPGTFRDSIHVAKAKDRRGMPASKVVSDDPKASFKEFGTADTPEHAVFAKTAAHFGWHQPSGKPVKGHIE